MTGSNFLIKDEETGTKILIDCGLFQGTRSLEEKNWENFPFDPKEIDYLIVTHAHLDHIGRIPRLVKEGFKGQIYSTPPTKEIAELGLLDSLGLMEKEANEELFYEEIDVKNAMSLWKTFKYHEPIKIGTYNIVFRDSGHILGSAMVEFQRGETRFIATGDLGNSPSPILKDTEEITGIHYLIMESVYGDRNHEDRAERKSRLEDVIEETMRAGGTLMIPVFSIERTQEILFEIESMMENSRIPLVPVFLDSPMGIRVTDVYKKYSDHLNETVRKMVSEGNSIFRFPQLHITLSTEESKAIFDANPKKIILAGSGMSTGGRILHHEKNYLSDPKSTLLLVGYQQVGSLGRLLQDGAKSVKIMGEEVVVNARIEIIHGYSAHKDSDHLLEFVQTTDDTLRKVFVCMGEMKSSLFLTQRLRDYLGVDAVVPEAGQTITLDL